MNTLTSHLPWHKEAYDSMLALAKAGRLGHAWVVSGQQGLGKLAFVRSLAMVLNCRTPKHAQACGICKDCLYFQAGTHPDWRLLQPEKKHITIDQVRESMDFAFNKSQRGGYKVLCMEPAEAMNSNAANALLKLLEEPPADTLLFLVAKQPGLLLPTLRSRCQHLKLHKPDSKEAIDWLLAKGCTGDVEGLLQLASGAPLQALAMADSGLQQERLALLQVLQELHNGRTDPVSAARSCEKSSLSDILDYLMQIVAMMLRSLQANIALPERHLEVLQASVCSDMPARQKMMALHAQHAKLAATRRLVMSSNNPNHQLILEQVMAEWSKLGRQLPAGSGRR
jgi:DNA polymerase III subunit delta'